LINEIQNNVTAGKNNPLYWYWPTNIASR